MQIFDRKTQTLIQQPEVGIGAIRFVYGTSLGRMLAKGILCRKFVSNAYAAWQKSCFSRGKVRKFMAQYQISVDDCTTREFPNFNAFFTRRRRCYVNQTPETGLPAIADAKLTALPIDGQSVCTVKGVPYTVAELLDDAALAARYVGGLCLIFRLAPSDYHRYAYPDNGRQDTTRLVPGVLHTVHPLAADLRVYRRNTRTVTVLHTEHFGQIVQLEVGALLVGKICNHCETDGEFTKLQEKGYFAYGGSTVILLLQHGTAVPDADIAAQSAAGIETQVHLGEQVASVPKQEVTP